jgi:hypothetical protein
MILAVTQLQQSLFGDIGITTGGGGINAHTLRWQVIDPQQLSHQFLLASLPVDVIAEQTQEIGQPIIGQILCLQGVEPTATQRVQSSHRPLLHPIHPMIGEAQRI